MQKKISVWMTVMNVIQTSVIAMKKMKIRKNKSKILTYYLPTKFPDLEKAKKQYVHAKII